MNSPYGGTRLAQVRSKISPEANVAGAVYGLIVVGSLLAAESGRGLGYGEILGSAALALILYWLAHGYAAFLGQRLEEDRSLSASELRNVLLHEWEIGRAHV